MNWNGLLFYIVSYNKDKLFNVHPMTFKKNINGIIHFIGCSDCY